MLLVEPWNYIYRQFHRLIGINDHCVYFMDSNYIQAREIEWKS